MLRKGLRGFCCFCCLGSTLYHWAWAWWLWPSGNSLPSQLLTTIPRLFLSYPSKCWHYRTRPLYPVTFLVSFLSPLLLIYGERHICGCQRTICRSLFSTLTMWVPGIDLRSSGTFTPWAIHLTRPVRCFLTVAKRDEVTASQMDSPGRWAPEHVLLIMLMVCEGPLHLRLDQPLVYIKWKVSWTQAFITLWLQIKHAWCFKFLQTVN